MFQRFTAAARAVVRVADTHARRFNHKRIGTEHLLLALATLGEGEGKPLPGLPQGTVDQAFFQQSTVAQSFFHRAGVPPASVQSAVEELVAPAEKAEVEISEDRQPLPLTPNAEQAFGFACQEALEANELDTGHWLVGLLRAHGVAHKVLADLGVTLDDARANVEGVRRAGLSPEHAAEVTTQLVTFWRKFGHLLGTGVPILEALKVIAEEMADTPLSEVATEVATEVGQGGTVYERLLRFPRLVSRSVVDLVRTGECAGDLDKKALLIADGLEQGLFPVGRKEVEAEAGGGSMPGAAKEPEKEPDTEGLGARKLTNTMLLEAAKSRASDIHLEAVPGGGGEDGVLYRVRFRIDGALSTWRTLAAESYKRVINRLKTMADLDLGAEARRQLQDGRIVLKMEGREVDLRLATAPARFGEMVTIRVLDRAAIDVSLDRLGFSEQHLSDIKSVLHRPSGLFIVAGPQGSGKTTVLYTLLFELDSERLKICTAEDPVEYDLAGLNQVQVNMNVGITFPSLVRAFLRSDPDVIMMGDIRDQESAWLANAAALTGHLFFTTLNTNDAPSALRRLLDIGVEPWLIGDAMLGVLSSRLARRLCQECRKPIEGPHPALQALDIPEELKSASYYQAVGCDECRGTGYRGRIGIYELLMMSDKVRRALLGDPEPAQLRDTAIKAGMVPMLVDGLQKAAQGLTSVEEVTRILLGV